MDVQCERCKTEYVFDDALVSGRGTTVRCTQCGHEFKVRRVDAGELADRWVVRTQLGQQLTFLTLRELQRAILARQISREDILLLNGAPPREIGSILELQPCFDGHTSSRPPPATMPQASFYERSPIVRAAPAPVSSSPPPSSELSSPLPPPTVPVRRSVPAADDDLLESHSAFPPSSDEGYEPPRRRVGGWVVAFVLLLAVGVVGWAVAKPYLAAQVAAPGPSSLAPRAAAFVGDGERALLEGDLDSAQQNFDKASALAERDPRVLLDEGRVAAARADVPWLTLRLLPAAAVEEARTVRAQLEERVARATRAVDEAVSVAPDDPGALRAKIDVFRLRGEQAQARALVPRVSALASQSETAYVLAALDLSEPQPLWTTVLDRLRQASTAEGNAGRARAAFVYALAASGDYAGARVELARLDALSRPYPALADLHAYVERAAQKAQPDGGTTTAPRASAEPSAAPSAAPPPSSHPAAGRNAAAAEGMPSDSSSALLAASQAIKRADFARARRIYEALIARNPSDSEALAGLGDVDRAQGDGVGAVAAYKRALAVNPSYLPALLGVADTEWTGGNRLTAVAAYKDIEDRFPEGTYPAYVKLRGEPAPAPPTSTDPSTGAGPKLAEPSDEH